MLQQNRILGRLILLFFGEIACAHFAHPELNPPMLERMMIIRHRNVSIYEWAGEELPDDNICSIRKSPKTDFEKI